MLVSYINELDTFFANWTLPGCFFTTCTFPCLIFLETLTDVEAETPVLWPPDAKSWLTGKDLDAGKDWGQKEKGATKDEMIGWHHWLIGLEFEQTLRGSEGQGSLACCSPWGLRVGCDWATEQHKSYPPHIFIHSSTVGHFNCFHILATVNNALVTIYLSSMFSCPLDKYQKTSWVIW